ncbi:hypothetical protein [Thalassotalea insulae]|uniref:hypothetical protein n=1 Tax=Thalassotalea insulae TaxID=2056778 RepID=UPI0024E1980F|nr:hypothetical protein [Thalassotalea insulae]
MGILSLLAASAVAYAGGGYWDYRKVCEYETITVNDPVTHCSYSGSIYADDPSIGRPMYVTSTKKLDNHVSCPAEVTVSRVRKVEVDDGRWEFVRFTGEISLTDESHSYDSHEETQVIEGSCRMVKVWVPCDTHRGCQGEP